LSSSAVKRRGELGDGFVGCRGSGIQSRIKLYLERKKNNPRIGGREEREREKEGRSDRTGKVRGVRVVIEQRRRNTRCDV
jgi:hypothetical protein